MLADLRVLEIAAPPTMLAGQILADLGADVVTVEPPQGSPGRRLDPFIDDLPGLERSLVWHALNHNKRAITLRYDCGDGRELLSALLPKFDIVLEATESKTASALEGLALPERLVQCLITPFSRLGPKARYRAEDLILMAASGAPSLAGERGRPPLFFPLPQAMMEAGGEAAIAALAGIAARDSDGVGQSVHVSARTAAMMSALSRPIAAFSGDKLDGRTSALAGSGLTGTRAAPAMYACADGHMVISVVFGAAFVAMTREVVRWAIDEGALAEHFGTTDWQQAARRASTDPDARSAIDALVETLRTLCRRRTKTELAAIARRYGFMAAPVMTMADIASSEHYHERGLFAPVSIGPAHRQVDVPARFIQFSNYTIDICRPAPQLSEHTAEILDGELGLSKAELQALFVHGVI